MTHQLLGLSSSIGYWWHVKTMGSERSVFKLHLRNVLAEHGTLPVQASTFHLWIGDNMGTQVIVLRWGLNCTKYVNSQTPCRAEGQSKERTPPLCWFCACSSLPGHLLSLLMMSQGLSLTWLSPRHPHTPESIHTCSLWPLVCLQLPLSLCPSLYYKYFYFRFTDLSSSELTHSLPVCHDPYLQPLSGISPYFHRPGAPQLLLQALECKLIPVTFLYPISHHIKPTLLSSSTFSHFLFSSSPNSKPSSPVGQGYFFPQGREIPSGKSSFFNSLSSFNIPHCLVFPFCLWRTEMFPPVHPAPHQTL